MLSMHTLQQSEHLVCHAPYQPQIIYLTHNEVLPWGGEVNFAFIVIFKDVFIFKCVVCLKSLYLFSQSFETSILYGSIKHLYYIAMCKHSHHFLSLSKAQFPNVIQIPFCHSVTNEY